MENVLITPEVAIGTMIDVEQKQIVKRMRFSSSNRKTRINPETGRIETWVQPAGRPGIWIDPGFCERCDAFNECLGLMKLNDEDWEEIKSMIESVKTPVQVAEVLDIFGHWPLKACGEGEGNVDHLHE